MVFTAPGVQIRFVTETLNISTPVKTMKIFIWFFWNLIIMGSQCLMVPIQLYNKLAGTAIKYNQAFLVLRSDSLLQDQVPVRWYNN
jgi:hypothetical protein